MGSEELGARFRHAAAWHPHRHRAWRGVGLGRSAPALRNDDVQGDAAAGNRLRGGRLPGLGTDRGRVAAAEGDAGSVPDDPRAAARSVDPDAVATWYMDGERRWPARSLRNPGLAKTFRILQQQGRDGFYKGEIAQAIVDKSAQLGGTMTIEDLANYSGEWTTPATDELQGLRRLHAAAAGADVGRQRDAQHPRSVRAEVDAGTDSGHARSGESEVLAPVRRGQETRLPTISTRSTRIRTFSKVPLDRLLSKAHAESLCSRVDPARASSPAPGGNAEERRRHHRAVHCRSLTATWWRGSTASTRSSAPA